MAEPIPKKLLRRYLLPQGSDWQRRWQFKRRDVDGLYTPVDLADTQHAMVIKVARRLEADTLLTVNTIAPTVNGSVLTRIADPEGDYLDLFLSNEDVEALPPRTLPAELKRRWIGSGREDSIFDIEWIVTPSTVPDEAFSG